MRCYKSHTVFDVIPAKAGIQLFALYLFKDTGCPPAQNHARAGSSSAGRMANDKTARLLLSQATRLSDFRCRKVG